MAPKARISGKELNKRSTKPNHSHIADFCQLAARWPLFAAQPTNAMKDRDEPVPGQRKSTSPTPKPSQNDNSKITGGTSRNRIRAR